MPEELDILPTGEVRADGVRVGALIWDGPSQRMDAQGVFYAHKSDEDNDELDLSNDDCDSDVYRARSAIKEALSILEREASEATPVKKAIAALERAA